MASNLASINIQQSVFGYDDGHRLLATSKPLSAGDSSRLLLASDLAPGLSTAEDVDYWTGIPLVEEQHYALLRTWGAPEISRPGCVWTHALRIPFAEMSRFTDLGILRNIPRRPVIGQSWDTYGVSINAVPERAGPINVISGDEARIAAWTLLRSVYGRSNSPLRQLPKLEEALFALWSQQWPKLRRHFSFRTAVGPQGSPRELRIGLQILASTFPGNEAARVVPLEWVDWEAVAIEDLFAEQPSELRRFLWRYGSDIRHVFDGFKVLTELFIKTRVDRIEGTYQRQTLLAVASAFPDADDARLLKTDLVALSGNSYSRLPEIDPLGAWEFLFEQTVADHWPALPSLLPDVLPSELISRPDVVVGIAEKALHSSSPAARHYLNIFANSLSPDTFWRTVANRSELMQAIAETRPELLDHQDLARLPNTDLASLLERCSLDDGLATRVVTRLIQVDHPAVAVLMWTRHTEIVIHATMEAVSASRAAEGWMTLIGEHPERWIRTEVLSQATSARALGRIAERFNPESLSVLAAGAHPWEAALRSLSDSADEIGLLTFVMIVALKVAEPSSEYLFERAFEPVYEGITRKLVPPPLLDSLARTFPHVPFWKEWDVCYRLTLAVAKAYVGRHANANNLANSISDWYLRQRFLRLVDSLASGDYRVGDFTTTLDDY